jgi:hypothetical protein
MTIIRITVRRLPRPRITITTTNRNQDNRSLPVEPPPLTAIDMP